MCNFSLPSLMNNEIWYPVSTNAHAYVKNMSKYRAALLKMYCMLCNTYSFVWFLSADYVTFQNISKSSNNPESFMNRVILFWSSEIVACNWTHRHKRLYVFLILNTYTLFLIIHKVYHLVESIYFSLKKYLMPGAYVWIDLNSWC